MLQLGRCLCITALSSSLAWCGSFCISTMDAGSFPLPRATVTIIDLEHGTIYRGETDLKGTYRSAELADGYYSIEVGGVAGFLNVKYYPLRIIGSDCKKAAFTLPFGEIDQYMSRPTKRQL